MRLKWYGTATILLEHDGTRLLFDPFFTLNESLFCPSADEYAKAEHILITHGHLDHIVHIPQILQHGGNKATVYCTGTPRRMLVSKGVDVSRLVEVSPGDSLVIGPFDVSVLKSRHIAFDARLVLRTFLSPRVLSRPGNMKYLLRENKVCLEAGETVVYDITVHGVTSRGADAPNASACDKHILLLGSLNLDDGTEYPTGADLLIIPLQGRSDICTYAIPFIDRLQPKMVLPDHYDDTFPPISSYVNPQPFIENMRLKHPEVRVLCPPPGPEWVDIW